MMRGYVVTCRVDPEDRNVVSAVEVVGVTVVTSY